MIAEQEPGGGAVCGQTVQPLDDTRRGRAAIDQVAEEDQRRLRAPARRVVRVDRAEQAAQLVVTAMDIAHRIDAFAIGDRRGGSGRRAAPL